MAGIGCARLRPLVLTLHPHLYLPLVVGSFGPIHSDLDAVTSERNSGMEAIQNSLFVGLPSPPTRMLVHKKLDDDDAFGYENVTGFLGDRLVTLTPAIIWLRALSPNRTSFALIVLIP